MAPTLYRSSDTGAPILNGCAGALRNLLECCLVDGYGSTRATNTITSSGVNVSNNDTVTVNGTVYTFKTALTPAANEVLIGANAAASLSNLCAAMSGWGTSGTTYGAGTTYQSLIQVTALTSTVITLTAMQGGTGGNAYTLSDTAATLTSGGATFSGGSGTDTTASLGWTNAYQGTTANQTAFRQPGGNQHYLQIEDGATLTGLAREASMSGWETMTAYNTGTGQFPTSTLLSTLVPARKSTTVDVTARTWFLIGDNRTFYLFVLTGDQSGIYCGFGFGDFYSYVATDLYKTFIAGNGSSSASALTAHKFGTCQYGFAAASATGQYIPRNFAGVGGPSVFAKFGDTAAIPVASAADVNFVGVAGFPNPSDGGMYVAPIRIMDGSTPGATVTGTLNLRGRFRGLWHCIHPTAQFADGDTVPGAGEYTGRTFMAIRSVLGFNTVGSLMITETTSWDSSS